VWWQNKISFEAPTGCRYTTTTGNHSFIGGGKINRASWHLNSQQLAIK